MNMDIYDGNEWVGELGASSIFDLDGPSYVHIYLDKRRKYGMMQEPYDLFFDTYERAKAAAKSIVGDGFNLHHQ